MKIKELVGTQSEFGNALPFVVFNGDGYDLLTIKNYDNLKDKEVISWTVDLKAKCVEIIPEYEGKEL